MRNYLFFGVILLGACGGNMQNPSQNAPAQTPSDQPYRYSGPDITPGASTGFAKEGDSVNDVVDGTEFGAKALSIFFHNSDLTPNSYQQADISTIYKSANELDVVINGTVYPLTYDPDIAEFTRSDPEYAGEKVVSVFFDPQNEYAVFASTGVISSQPAHRSGEIFISAMGFTTDPNRLPANASYSGEMEISTIPEAGAGDAAFGEVNFDADFANGTMIGLVALRDEVGDTTGPIDLRDMDLTFKQAYFGSSNFDFFATGGSIVGNSFSLVVDASHDEWAKSGFTSAPNLTLIGSFFGPNGEFATGAGVGNGWAPGFNGSTQVILLGTLNAAKN